MRNIIALVTAMALCVSVVGCASFGGIDKIDPTEIALAYYKQERTFEPVKIEGVQNVTLQAAEGHTLTITVTNPLEPLSIYPRDPATLKTMLDGIADLATIVAAGIVGYELVDAISASPTVVEPTVVEVPSP